MADCTILAYLAGAIDSDGCISIKRSTYHIRVRHDARNALYHERISLKQVTPQIPELLRQTFGGTLRLSQGLTVNSKPFWGWDSTDKNAARACAALLRYLRVKRKQAELVLELRESKHSRYRQAAYWFAIAHPAWRDEDLITTGEAAAMLGHTNAGSLSQAIANGMLLALPYDHCGKEQPRIPRALVLAILPLLGKDGRAQCQPPELIAWKERLHREVAVLNTIGLHGTPPNHRTGPYVPAG